MNQGKKNFIDFFAEFLVLKVFLAKLKTKSSFRTLPLIPEVRTHFESLFLSVRQYPVVVF